MLNGLTAVCGPSCTQCQVYNATKSGDRKELEKIAAEWTKGLFVRLQPTILYAMDAGFPATGFPPIAPPVKSESAPKVKAPLPAPTAPNAPVKR